MSMYNPAHPGEILKELVIEPLDMSITEVAHHLDISTKILSKILTKEAVITPEIALRLEMTFGKPNAAHWLRLQMPLISGKFANVPLTFMSYRFNSIT